MPTKNIDVTQTPQIGCIPALKKISSPIPTQREINNISNNLNKQSVDFYKQAFAETSKVKKVSSWSKKARSKYDSLVANNKTKTIKDGFDYKNSQLSIKPVYMGLDFSDKDIVESLSH